MTYEYLNFYEKENKNRQTLQLEAERYKEVQLKVVL